MTTFVAEYLFVGGYFDGEWHKVPARILYSGMPYEIAIGGSYPINVWIHSPSSISHEREVYVLRVFYIAGRRYRVFVLEGLAVNAELDRYVAECIEADRRERYGQTWKVD